METTIVKKLTSPQNITLYRRPDSPNIFYYFTWNKKSYRGSTGTADRNTSINKMNDIYYELTHKIRKTKIVKFEKVVKEFVKWKEKSVAAKTFIEYKRGCKYLSEKFGKEDIEKFGGKDIYLKYQKWREKYYETHKTRVRSQRNGKYLRGRIWKSVGNVTLNRECRLLVSILRFGKAYLRVLKDTQVSPYTVLPEKRREEILTKKEYLKLEKYWNEKNEYYWNIISFVNNTGVRYPSELINIKWKDVDLKRKYVLIRDRKNKNKSQTLNTPVPLVGSSMKILQSLKERNNISTEDNDYVFVNDKGIRIKNIGKSFKNSLKDCGIDKSLTMYSLRHLFTTRMMKRPDIPMMMISMVLGHRDTTMVEKVYGHLRVGDVIEAFERSEKNKQKVLEEKTGMDNKV